MSRAMLAAVLHNLENNPDNMTFGKLNDISDDAWYAEAVLWASENGIVKGYPDGSFAPDLPITREQLAVMLWRYAGSPRECGDIMSTFPDAKNVSDYAKAAMEWAVSNGIIKGDNSRNINPKSHATRAHAAQMIMNFMLNVR